MGYLIWYVTWLESLAENRNHVAGEFIVFLNIRRFVFSGISTFQIISS